MASQPDALRSTLAEAQRRRELGDTDGAREILERLLAQSPRSAPAWNLFGLTELQAGRVAEAIAGFSRATEIDPAPPLWLNLARAQRAKGLPEAELESLNRALSADAYYLPAILDKGEVLVALGRQEEALELYRLLFDGFEQPPNLPPSLQSQLERARSLLDANSDERMKHFSDTLSSLADKFPEDDLRRARAYAEQRAGKRKVFQQRPTGGHMPYLPAIEFFDSDLFPWFAELEAATGDIREELLSLWAEEDPNFRPYVAYPAGTPANQWADLNHSTRWSAWFFWENGVRNDANCERCPKTAAAIERVPLLDVPGKAPTAMFSVLQPRTRIPPHTGTSNTRTTVHLPLVVPPGCGFRVGAETREWKEGECWGFDDTIEHEAWNDSPHPRAILIVDCWNPLLTAAEREAVRLIG